MFSQATPLSEGLDPPLGTKMCPAFVSWIVTGERPVNYWPTIVSSNGPRSLSKGNLSIFLLGSNVTNGYIVSIYLFIYLFIFATQMHKERKKRFTIERKWRGSLK